jgi:hypothetical protein
MEDDEANDPSLLSRGERLRRAFAEVRFVVTRKVTEVPEAEARCEGL